MTSLQLIDNTIPQLQLQDTLAKALQLMHDFRITHLPVVSEEKYLGLISEEDLLDEENKNTTLAFFQNEMITAAVNGNQHFLKAVSVCNLYQTNVIPVIGDNQELMGTIRGLALLTALGNFCGADEYGAMVVLEMERTRFSLVEINSIVENDDATILHLNIASLGQSQLSVTLQINKKEISTIIATFERYDYSVSYYSGTELFENDLSANYQNLMNYLDI